jgi:dTDP-4-amino-4,6-dideoxygalactose transaminase
VFEDVEPDTLMLTPQTVRPAITSRTRAIVPVHLYGLCADMTALRELAAESGLPLVEDAAQAIGATCDGRAAGALGTIGCFSFFPSKNLGAYGDAGLVTTADEALAARVRRLRNHGMEPKYLHQAIGGNFRLDALQAAILRVKLPHLSHWNDLRRTHAATYRSLFEEAGLTGRVRLPDEAPGRRHIFHQYVIRVPGRDALRAHLAQRGVGTDVYYPVPLHRQACFAGLTPPDAAFPHANAAAADVLALPVYPELTHAQQAHVVRAIAEWQASRQAE